MPKHESIGVLHVTPVCPPNVGGIEAHIYDLRDYFCRRGYRVYVLTYMPKSIRRILNVSNPPEAPAREKHGNFEIERVGFIDPLGIFFRLRAAAVASFFEMLAYLFSYMLRNRDNIDVLHAHGSEAYCASLFIARLFGKKVVFTAHNTLGTAPTPRLPFYKFCVSRADHGFAISELVKSTIVNYGLSPGKITTVYSWIDMNAYKEGDKGDEKKRLRLPNKFTVLFVGRLVKDKGVMQFIDAARLVGDDTSFIVIGIGALEKYVQEQADLLRNVKYAGGVSADDAPRYYRAADVFVIPSQNPEGFGRVLIEALASGTPVIASNRGSIPEGVTDEVGLLIEPMPENIASAILFLKNNKKEYLKRRKACRKYALHRFSEKNAGIIAKVYREVLSR
jgi:glycosyltransferase involved in cell wall biosynthesis